MIILDLIVVAFMLLSAFSGYKKGLSDMVMKLVGTILALVLAFSFRGVIADFIIQNTNFDDNLVTTIESSINDAILKEPVVEQPGNEQKENIDNAFYNSIIKNVGVEQTSHELAVNITNFVFNALGFIIIFLAVTIITFIIRMVGNLVFELPILSSINSFGGLAGGALVCVIKVWVVLAILSMVAPMIPTVANAIEQTVVIKTLYYNNFIVKLLSNGFKL